MHHRRLYRSHQIFGVACRDRLTDMAAFRPTCISGRLVMVLTLLAASSFVVLGDDNEDDVIAESISSRLQQPLPALFDVGRLWVRASIDQWYRVIDAVTSLLPCLAASPWLSVCAIVVVVYAVYGLLGLLLAPLDRVRLLGDVGYIGEGRVSAKDMVEVVKRRRAVGDVPPVYPNGWFSVCESRSLRVGQAKTISCLGKNFAVFRAENGQAHIIDAYCPHMGADLAAGGVVKGNCLECPFHGWQFRGEDGKCVHIPYCDRKSIPEVAKVQSYASMECNGFIFVWFHAEGLDPQWQPPLVDEIKDHEWTYRGRTEHIVNAHIEEIPENGADIAHLEQVHGPIMTAGIDLRYMYSRWWSFAKHHWCGEWNQDTDPDQAHIGILTLVHRIRLFGYTCPILDMKVWAQQIGPGIVNMTYESPIFGRGMFIQTLTPIEPLTLRMVHQVYSHRWLPTPIAKFFLYSEALMVERDLMIWNNKRYVSKPIFVKSKEDSLIQRHRRWYAQFYSEHSPRIKLTPDVQDW